MTLEIEVQKLRIEAGQLRRELATKLNAWLKQKQKNNKLEEQLKEKDQKIKELEQKLKDVTGERDKLHGLLHSAELHANKLTGQLFKSARGNKPPSSRKKGGQLGHKGHGRKNSKAPRIDEEKEVYLSHCPNCHNPLERSNNTYTRLVTDIPLVSAITTKYTIQRQWCSGCKKEATADPQSTVPHSPFGLNLVLLVLFVKYRLRLPLQKIQELLWLQYKLKLSASSVQNILYRSRSWLGPAYGNILKAIKKASVKHADETNWKIDGQNGWAWIFTTLKQVYYSLEPTRGKGVVEKILGASFTGTLVHDDYSAYQKLEGDHESCWSHLLRILDEYAGLNNPSEELLNLKAELEQIFADLKEFKSQGSCLSTVERQRLYQEYLDKLIAIGSRPYKDKDALAVQTRINNQQGNLLTSILKPEVPLTNNHAERQLRPLVIIRKISGSSRSDQGAAATAVNMSVVQTLSLQGKNVFTGLKEILTATVGMKYVLEKGE